MAWYPAGPSRQREAQNAYDELFNRIASATTPDDYEAIVDFIKSKSKYTLICDNALNGPLHIAIRHRKLELLSLMLSTTEVEVNQLGRFDGTPLHLCLTEKVEIQYLEKLIAAGANLNLPNKRLQTPLHLAMKCDHQYAHLLIQHGALINETDAFLRTPLHYAVIEKNLDNVCLLLYYNADANIGDLGKQTPFMLSIRDPEKSIIQEILLEYENAFLVEENELHTVTQNKLYKLLRACIRYKNLEMFKIVWSRISPDIRELILDESPNLIIDAPFDYIDFVLRNGSIDLTKLLEFCPAMRDIWKTAACEDTDKQVKMFVDTVYLYLSYGGIFSVGDIQFLHSIQDYETIKKLSRVILFTDIDMRFERVLREFSDIPYIIPYVMCNIHENIRAILVNYCYQFFTCVTRSPQTPSIIEECEKNVQQFFRFSSSRRFLTFLRQIVTSPRGNPLEFTEIRKLPSLQELSRNRAKDAICERYNIRNACQFYTTLESLPMIPEIAKDIISFRTPIYENVGRKIINVPSE